MPAFNNCLFYRITPTETTYIIVYVDDTFILSNSHANIDTVITSIGKHYEVTLDREATSCLGLHLAHNTDGTVTITQPKLLAKLFSLYPPLKGPSQPPLYPYSPLPKDTDPTNQPADHYAYLRLLGILLFLTKSRPDIMAAVSFAGTRSSNPTERDLRDLYYVVEHLRATQHSTQVHHPRTTYLLRSRCIISPTFRHSGYTISFRAHSTIVALNKPPSPPPPHTPKPEQFSHSPRN